MIEFVEYEEMPDDNEDIAKFDIVFPNLQKDQSKRYKEFVDNLVDYLHDEGETVGAGDLKFIKAVQVKEQKYWIWEFHDKEDNDQCFAVVSEGPHGSLWINYDMNWHNLSPDQFILGDYHRVY